MAKFCQDFLCYNKDVNKNRRYEGLQEVLPAGYPRVGGLIVLRGAKRAASKRRSGRYRGAAKKRGRWYRLYREI